MLNGGMTRLIYTISAEIMAHYANVIVKQLLVNPPVGIDDAHQGISQENSHSVNTLMIQNNYVGYRATILTTDL